MIEQLQESFKDITYNDGQHRYFYKGNTELQSVTKYIGTLKPLFNSSFWSILKAYQFSGYEVKSIWKNFSEFRLFEPGLPFGAEFRTVSIFDDTSHLTVSPDDVKKQWERDSNTGKLRGTYIHNYLENLENRVIDVPKTELPEGISTAEAVNYVNSIKIGKELCLEFVKYAQENLILIVSEFTIGDPRIGLAGRFDRLYFNKSTKEYEIWDFKTDKQIRYKSSFGNLAKFNLPDCEFEKYSLQTSIYKKIIQDCTGVQLGTSRVVWFNLKENKYEIIDCADYTQLITEKLNTNTTVDDYSK